MANPFGDDFDDELTEEVIQEGFICPTCKQDFAYQYQLEQHFPVHFSGGGEAGGSQDGGGKLGSQIKGLIGKAKKKILKDDELFDFGSASPAAASELIAATGQPQQSSLPHSAIYGQWRKDQEFGQSRSHLDEFKQYRDKRVERYVIETNKLLIRLDKLIRNAPTDVQARKEHERNVVIWCRDADVPLCPSCAKSFNLARRRHHCRLCGGIMCHACSQFLDFEYALKLISPVNVDEQEDAPVVTSLNVSANGSALLSRSSSRRGSNSSLLSIMNTTTGEQHIRVCYDCKVLLDRRNDQIEEQRLRPILVAFYDRLKSNMAECEKLLPVYYKMCYSFGQGESTYQLSDASDLRVKLLKMAELIDALSRKIANLGVAEGTASQLQMQLQAKLRLAATQFLKEHLIGLPSLPSLEELEKAQEERRQQISRKIELERKALIEEQLRQQLNKSMKLSDKQEQQRSQQRLSLPRDESQSSFELVSPDNGWSAEGESTTKFTSFNAPSDEDQDDPLLQQINRIRGYIKSARADHRYDEVSMLEANLKELENEYFVQKMT